MPKKQRLVEIERKFLVTSDAYKSQAVKHYEIIQGYLAKGEGRTIRVRIQDNEAFLTIKGGAVTGDGLRVTGSGLARFEWEKAIDVQDAKALLQLALPGMIEKTRWIVPCKGERLKVKGERELFWEVDEFHGRLEGRTLAEIELDYEDQAFLKPDFIGEEVTGQKEYYNANM